MAGPQGQIQLVSAPPPSATPSALGPGGAGATVPPGGQTQTSYVRLAGLAGSTKPVATADGNALPAGSFFDELDTYVRWIWDGQLWRFLGPIDLTLGQVAALLQQTLLTVAQALTAEIRALKVSLFAGQSVEAADVGLSAISDPSTGA